MTAPNILEKFIRFKSVQWKNGKFLLWSVPGLISPLYTIVYLQRLLEQKYDYNEIASMLYNMGKLQARQGFRMISERFGYKKRMSKTELLTFCTGQSEIVGIGSFKWTKIDFKNNFFLVRGKSSLAEEYKKFFGSQKEPIDHFFRGEITAFIEELTNKKMLTIEKRCIATNNSFCEFLTKPINEWDDDDDEFIKKQFVKKMPNMKQLGAKIEPYLVSY